MIHNDIQNLQIIIQLQTGLEIALFFKSIYKYIATIKITMVCYFFLGYSHPSPFYFCNLAEHFKEPVV